MKFTPLPRRFYQPSAEAVAPALLGHFLIRRTPGGFAGGPMVETEAYLCGDPACHAAGGLTPRNRSMFGPPGHGYVYLIYGYHFCFNAVCQASGVGEAVLVRALEPEFGLDFMRARRPVAERALSSGPAKLCQALAIDRSLDAADLCDSESEIFIARNPAQRKFLEERGPMVTTTRIGISQAADRPLRFYLEGSQWVSRRRPSITCLGKGAPKR
jgi:DNA-3-methyladenine glycosylase